MILKGLHRRPSKRDYITAKVAGIGGPNVLTFDNF